MGLKMWYGSRQTERTTCGGVGEKRLTVLAMIMESQVKYGYWFYDMDLCLTQVR